MPPSYRSRYNAHVNCWFCNGNTRVPYPERNSWNCPHCDQYNGFTKDGDYNRDMTSQRDCSHNSDKSHSQGSSSICANSYYADVLAANPAPAQTNGLCDLCNEAQRLKVEKLSQFEPKNESRFEQELKVYREQLEQQFRLCSSCERHVNKVLHEKKKMVLGSKFLNFIIKGAALLKQPHFNRLASAQRQRKLHFYRLAMTLLTIGNIICLLCHLPQATGAQFKWLLGDFFGTTMFKAYSHGLALVRVLMGSVGRLLEKEETSAKLLLYARTFGKLLLYSVGLNQQQIQQATFASCYYNLYPYIMLALSFLYKINDGLKFTRFTVVLLMWSANAKIRDLVVIDDVVFLLLGSALTLVLLSTGNSSLLKHPSPDETAGESFHRLCADECISDEETLSLLSQQLSGCSSTVGNNNNSASNMSLPSASVCMSPAPTISPRSVHMPPASLLSLGALRLSKHQQQEQQHLGWRSNYGGSGVPSMGFQQQQRPSAARPMESPWYRHSTSNLSQAQPFARSTQNLINPSRLPMSNRNLGGGDVSAWVAATQSINQDLGTASLMRHYEEKQPQQISRTSSQSSGFESQPARMEQQWGSGAPSAPPLSDYGWPELRESQRNLVVPPLASPAPTLTSEYQSFGRSSLQQMPMSQHVPPPQTQQKPMQQQTIQPGDLLRKWIESSRKM
ncbi:hypothetical protein KR026_007450 [Drosophila bipectinata]|nr:hypothetical protein KR026_007450 [Drosophila bipectinata]